jgi:tetratricopeptide (TPR) repeat protein
VPRNNRLKNRVILVLTFTAVLVVGCTRYIPQSQIVPIEELAHYNPKNFAHKKDALNRGDINEDKWIVQAIFYEQNSDFKKSNYYYKKLYKETGKDEYLLKELKTALYSGLTSDNILKLKEYVSTHPTNLVAKRLLLSSYLYEKKYKEAKEVSALLLKGSTEAVDFELSANAYIFTKDYPKAVELLTEAYNKTYNENILLKITTILVNYMGNISDATIRLENHRTAHKCSENICLQLISIYFQQNNVSKIIPLYKALYASSKKEEYAEKVIESYLHLKDYDGAIAFLKSEYNNPELLYSLYIESKAFDKADKLSRKLMLETSDPKWYAESAMSLYEASPDKNDKAMLAEVVKRFEIAMEKGIENTIYLNYYGYTLIDKDIDIEKGMKIIEKALIEQPDNSYYLDSLAWGNYKLGACKKALKLMKRVVEIEGLKEEEIRNHWNAIRQKCKE